MNLPLELDLRPKAPKQLRIGKELAGDKELFSLLKIQKQDHYFSMRIKLGDERERYVNKDEYRRYRIKENLATCLWIQRRRM